MLIKNTIFKGERPLLAAHELSQFEAMTATNCKLERGYLAPWKASSKTYELGQGTFNTLYRYEESGNKHWIVSQKTLNFNRSPIAGDPHFRMYMTGDGKPRVYCKELTGSPFDFDGDFYLLGVPMPDAPLTIDSGYTTDSTYRAYTYSYVVQLNGVDSEEGPPVDVASISDYGSGDVILSGFSEPPTDRQIGKIRIYRTNQSTLGIVSFQYVGEFETSGVDFTTYTFTDSVDDADLGTDTPYAQTFTPPPEGLKGLTSLFNGSFAGFVGNTVYVSEPYLPHAWPYSYPVEDSIVALGWYGTTLVALTDESPYILYGPPESMDTVKLPIKMPCLSEWALSAENGVIFASYEGLAMVDQNGIINLTENIITSTQWEEGYYPETMKLAYYESRIYVFHVAGGFILDTKNGLFTPISIRASAIYIERGSGDLFYIADDPDRTSYNAIIQWEADPNDYLQYDWKSKRFIMPFTGAFTAARVISALDEYTEIAALIAANIANAAANAILMAAGDVGGDVGDDEVNALEVLGDNLEKVYDLDISTSITFKLYGDGTLIHTETVTSNNPFRLTVANLYKRVEFELIGYVPVAEVAIATSMTELEVG